MASQDLTIQLQVSGLENAQARMAKMNATMTKFKENANGTFTATGKLGGAQDNLAGSTNRAAGATDRASNSQKKYFAHIARTTIQSALINKLFLEFVDVSGQAIQQVDQMNNFPAIMASMGQSTKESTDALQTMTKYVGEIGGNLATATSMVTRFTGVTKDVKASTAIFVGLNNALIAGDSSMEEQRLAATQFAQAFERGKPDMREWMSLTQNMSLQLNQVAESMGYVNADALGVALRDGTENMGAFTTALTELGTGTGKIALDAQKRMNGMQFAFNQMKNTMTQGMAAVVNAFGRANIVGFFQFLTQVIRVLTGWAVTLVNVLGSVANAISRFLGGGDIFKKITGDISSGIDDGSSSANDLGDNLKGAKDEAKELNKQLAGFDKMNVLSDKTSGKKDKDEGGGGTSFTPGEIGTVGDAFGNIGGDIQEASKWAKVFAGILAGIAAFKTVSFVWDMVGNAVKRIQNIRDGLKSAWEWAGRTWTNLKNLAKMTWNTLVQGVKDFWQNLKIAAQMTWDKLKQGVTDAYNKMKEIVQLKWQQLRDGLQRAIDKARELSQIAWTKTKEGLIKVKDAAIDAGNKIKDIVSSAAKTAAESAKHAAKTAAAWVSNAARAAAAWVAQMARVMATFVATAARSAITAAVVSGAWISGAIATAAAWIIANAAILGVIGLIIIAVAAAVYLIVKHWDTIKEVAVKVWHGVQDAIAGAIDWIKVNWPLVLAIITGPIGLAVYAIVKHWDTIKEAFSKAWQFIQEVWDKAIAWFQGVWNGIMKVFSAVGNWFKDRFREAWDGIKSIWSGLGNFFKERWENLKSNLSGVANWFKEIFQNAWNNVTKIFSGLWSWFRDNVWNKIVGTFSKIGTSIGDAISGAFKGIINTALNFVTNFINGLIRGINSAIGIINKIPYVSISRINEVSLPRLARGGIVEEATVAMIGEDGKEAVVPLENNTEWIDKLAAKINNTGENDGRPVQLVVQIGEEKIANKLIDLINERSQMTGRNSIVV